MNTPSTDEASLRAALASDPNDPNHIALLGKFLLARAQSEPGGLNAANGEEAFRHLGKAITLGEVTPSIVTRFIHGLRSIDVIPEAWNLSEAFLISLNSGLLPFTDFFDPFLAIFRGLSENGAPLAHASFRIWKGDVDSFRTQLAAGEFRDILGHPVLTSVMRGGVLTVPELECLLTETRRHFLRIALDTNPVSVHPSDRAFCYALADQCFLTEYAYWESPDEKMWCESLAETINATLKSGGSISDPFPIAVLACYRSLSTYDWAETLADQYTGTERDSFAMLVRRHIHEPRMEREIAAALPEISSITDSVSLKVKAQYEENPYPRWAGRTQLAIHPFPKFIQGRYPNADPTYLSTIECPDILYAGCGTGQHIMFNVYGLKDWSATAIDLSRASMAYAKRQLEAYGLRRISFQICDILNVSMLGKSFDLIECVGVLHHMSDPIAGWKALLDVLRPGGIMSVGLYSQVARKGINDAQKYIQAMQYKSTSQDIRRFRRDLIDAARKPRESLHPDLRPLANSDIRNFLDFYSLSMCRDLAFHVQERTYSISEIAEIIEDLGLQFLGFTFLPMELTRKYCQQFPDDPECTNLANWAEFEQAHPHIFRGMYLFGVQKPLE